MKQSELKAKLYNEFQSIIPPVPEYITNLQVYANREHKAVKTIGRKSLKVVIISAVVFVCLFAFSITAYMTPVSYVSVETPSAVELDLNMFDIVISANPLNEEGEKILEKVRLNGKHCQAAINEINRCSSEMGYSKNDCRVMRGNCRRGEE